MERLRRADLDPDPLAQFAAWFAAARDHGVHEPEAMTLATADAAGAPSARMVLLRGASEAGLEFYTNYTSRKAHDLDANPRAALVFYWDDMGRQIRVEGPVARVGREESAAYFRSRPRDSRIGAWASRQSTVIPDRETLERRVRETEARFPDDEVPVPDFWGGYRLRAVRWEFWQAHPFRLHDRFRYSPAPGGGWVVERLSP
ncbi:MAG: pyridoxamine 5'-phosphate oxidase [Thermoleophilia bacterium]|nr:pyridoxamine 5'-phosphate oxidase [Thermoleophilia bacterium]